MVLFCKRDLVLTYTVFETEKNMERHIIYTFFKDILSSNLAK